MAPKRIKVWRVLCAALLALPLMALAADNTYRIAPTGQRACYGVSGNVMACVGRSGVLAGQDADYSSGPLHYRDNGDGTVSDLNTGLVWQQSLGEKVSWEEAKAGARNLRLGKQSDWRLPTIKELYSLMDFSGFSPMPGRQGKPFIDPAFDFRYGDPANGERPIDVQVWSATEYGGKLMGHGASVFGVNFADGRIKGYPKLRPERGAHRMFVRYVRGNPDYGRNDFVDNRDGTVTDRATGLMWMQVDSGTLKAGPFGDGRMDWPQALAWATSLVYAGRNDWRLPNAKELQSLVDYQRSPQTSGSAAISPMFRTSTIRDEGGNSNYPFYWSSTSHLDGRQPGSAAVYVAFGEALGFMRMPWSGAQPTLMDVHGAGAQRSDPKVGNPADYPQGMGPQGDVRRIYNMVRLVRSDARASN